MGRSAATGVGRAVYSRARRRWSTGSTPRKRLIDALSTADVIAAEDTRRVRTPGHVARGDHPRVGSACSTRTRTAPESARWSREIAAGATVLLVSDAGMPLINDPGYRMVASARRGGVAVLPTRSLGGDHRAGCLRLLLGPVLRGFGPRKQSARRTWLAGLARRTPHGGVVRVTAAPRRHPWVTPSASSARHARRRAPGTHQDPGDPIAGRSGSSRTGPPGRAGGDHRRLGACALRVDPRPWWPEVGVLVERAGCGSGRLRDGGSRASGAPSRRELYDAVLRSRDS